MSRGRPSIESDDAALLVMASAIAEAQEQGKRLSVRKAARLTRDRLGIPGTCAAAVEDRLRRKFNADRSELMALVGVNYLPKSRIMSQAKQRADAYGSSESKEPALNAMVRSLEVEREEPRRRLDEFPSYVAARAKLTAIRADLKAKAERRTAVKAQILDLNRQQLAAIDEARGEYLRTGEVRQRLSLDQQLEVLEFEIDAINAAFHLQALTVAEEKSAAETEIIDSAREAHQHLVAAILDKAVALEEAIEAEVEFREGLNRESISTGTMAVVRDTLERSYGTRKGWNSKFNEFAIAASRYLGRREWQRGA